MRIKLLTLATLLTTVSVLQGQEITDISLLNVVNNEQVSLKSFPSCSGIVVVFTSNNCPYDEYYRARLKKISQEYQDRVPVFMVNAHTDAVESIENMKKKASADWPFPYLADKDQKLMQQLGATKSPHAFLLKNKGGKFEVVYDGAIDDNAQVESDVHHAYLKDAIDIMLGNQVIATPEVRPTGCTIRKKSS